MIGAPTGRPSTWTGSHQVDPRSPASTAASSATTAADIFDVEVGGDLAHEHPIAIRFKVSNCSYDLARERYAPNGRGVFGRACSSSGRIDKPLTGRSRAVSRHVEFRRGGPQRLDHRLPILDREFGVTRHDPPMLVAGAGRDDEGPLRDRLAKTRVRPDFHRRNGHPRPLTTGSRWIAFS